MIFQVIEGPDGRWCWTLFDGAYAECSSEPNSFETTAACMRSIERVKLWTAQATVEILRHPMRGGGHEGAAPSGEEQSSPPTAPSS